MAFTIHHTDGVTYLTSDGLRARHAFSTRCGGYSSLPHTATLNLAFGRGDDEETVRANLARFARVVGIDPHTVVSLPQVHGTTVHRVDGTYAGLGYNRPAGDLAGDGYVTTDPAVAVGVKTADCTPVLLEARCGERVVAVAALHAGWRGTVEDIVGEGVRALIAAADDPTTVAATSHPLTLHAAIGPCIHACCFEVQEDCLAAVRAALGDMPDPEEPTRRLMDRGIIRRPDGGYALDLPAINRALLLRAGLRAEHIDVCGSCTACHTALFYSHRAMHGVRGTMLSVCAMP